ncbi:hypothetical protein [Lacticaseibacillus suibinensis]|uniref:hypothetical protein n=1 Tax=Lacticaseibacillus suibinensis TaxID=2486011 RepID=UPI0019455970|nr:hypothetical protein [Lacticaseibacillus suibinensis]
MGQKMVDVYEAQLRLGKKWGGFIDLAPEQFPISEAEYMELEKELDNSLERIYAAAIEVLRRKEEKR